MRILKNPGTYFSCFVSLALAGCLKSDPAGSAGNFEVRVVNLLDSAITVVIGPADYGSIAPGDTTEYRNVNGGDNVLLVNGAVSSNSPANFGSGSAVDCRWTYMFTTGGSGFFVDDCAGWAL